ncbi:hypothetical protein BKA62DRAFT_765110 [Auriculariales sp. MPI-PUGE-AT-0066]|nr:hypothetical protein BKA62DRAFT_765110 [Auriculariales sp. MPI-PUGE-AT-0066]
MSINTPRGQLKTWLGLFVLSSAVYWTARYSMYEQRKRYVRELDEHKAEQNKSTDKSAPGP